MGRRIVSEQLQSGVAPNPPKDDYAERLLKYIPAEGVGYWLTVSGIVQTTGDDVPKAGLLWGLFVIGLVGTFLWTRRRTRAPGKPTAWTQIGISCIAFGVWVFAAGGPFATLSFYRPVYGALLLPTYTLFASLIVPPEQ
jgi:hypothetical protein